MTLEQFVNKYNGKYLDYDGYYGYQCVDMVRFYIKEALGYSPYTALPAGGSAKAIFNNFKENKYFKKIYNSPTNIPKKGSIIFWGWYPFVTGWNGHVAVVSDATMMRFISFDQNYPTGSPCKYVNHSYRGVMGWLEPKV